MKSGSSKERENMAVREGKNAPAFCKLMVSTRTTAGCPHLRETLKLLSFIWCPEQ